MKEKKIGGLEIGTGNGKSSLSSGYVIANFAEENCGKTRFALSGPGPIGMVPLEAKAMPTIEKDGDAEGIEVVRPANPSALWVQHRKVNAILGKNEDETNSKRQEFYMAHMRKVEEYTYGLLEHDEIRTICIDKFNTYCAWVEFAINGMSEKFIKVQGQVYKDRREVNQHIIDFLNELSTYNKVVILNNASKDDYEVVGADKKPIRKTWDGFKYLGSHCNLVVELVDNKFWDLTKNGDKYNWHYALNIRRSQARPDLEGPDGHMVLKDDKVSLPKLMKLIDGEDFDADRWM